MVYVKGDANPQACTHCKGGRGAELALQTATCICEARHSLATTCQHTHARTRAHDANSCAMLRTWGRSLTWARSRRCWRWRRTSPRATGARCGSSTIPCSTPPSSTEAACSGQPGFATYIHLQPPACALQHFLQPWQRPGQERADQATSACHIAAVTPRVKCAPRLHTSCKSPQRSGRGIWGHLWRAVLAAAGCLGGRCATCPLPPRGPGMRAAAGLPPRPLPSRFHRVMTVRFVRSPSHI